MFSGSPLFILTLTCLTKDAENVSKMLKPRLEKVPAAPIRLFLEGAICLADSFEFTIYHCMGLKAFRHK